jgi:hypothetical protein
VNRCLKGDGLEMLVPQVVVVLVVVFMFND